MTGDLNGDCMFAASDWMQFRSGQHADLTGLPGRAAYALGDLNGDYRNDHADFVMFKTAFEAANGSGTFTELLSTVPEPPALVFVAVSACVWLIAGCNRVFGAPTTHRF